MKQNQILEKLEQIHERQSVPQLQPLTVDEAATYLSISKSTLYKLTHSKRIAHSKPGGKKIYFLKSDLNEWLRKNRVSTSDEHAELAKNYLMSKPGGRK